MSFLTIPSKLLRLSFILCLMISGSSLLNAQSHRIVMQLTSDNPEVHKGLMKQLSNLTEGWKDSVAIEVVCHGPGIQLLMSENTTQKEAIYAMKKRGVDFVACENTMKAKNIPKEAFLEDIHYVMMGIAEIVIKQEQGWSYIKAGN